LSVALRSKGLGMNADWLAWPTVCLVVAFAGQRCVHEVTAAVMMRLVLIADL
jgi:hypothetical protein